MTSLPLPPTPKSYERRPVGRRMLKDRIFLGLCMAVASISLIALTLLLWSIAKEGFRYLNWNFLTEAPSRRAAKAGIGPAMWGTIWACAVCAT